MTFSELWLVRHGESVTNAAARAAEQAGLELIPSEVRGPDAPLSATGMRQAEALGRWLAALPEDERPTRILSSPFVRAEQTAAIALRAAGSALAVHRDERLRDREFGILTLLTDRGVQARHPEEHRRMQSLGPFYYRPPGGESWADVILRIRSILAELDSLPDERILIAAHDAVVIAVLYAGSAGPRRSCSSSRRATPCRTPR